MTRQTSTNQRGEIQYRRELLQQQVEGVQIFDDEFDAAGIESILRERMEGTHKEMVALRSRGVRISPYLEIGAERGQRSLVLENDLGCEGAALDLSYDMLRSCEYYRKKFGREKNPLRICADAYRLPFRSNSIPFVFCAQTLHHFPDPTPIVREIYRVLAPGGYFYFSEEPYRKVLHWNLYETDGSIKRNEQIGTFRRIVERFFAKVRVSEEEYGIIENVDISVRTWKRALSIFEEREVSLSVSHGRIRADLYSRKTPIRRALAVLLGGGISGLCRKAGSSPEDAISIRDALVSPVLLGQGREVGLACGGSAFVTEGDEEQFPVLDGVAFLMEPQTMRDLYPELSGKV